MSTFCFFFNKYFHSYKISSLLKPYWLLHVWHFCYSEVERFPQSKAILKMAEQLEQVILNLLVPDNNVISQVIEFYL